MVAVSDKQPAQSSPLRICGLSVFHETPKSSVRVVKDISLEVAPGEIVGLVGESGSGKSITCLSAMGLLGPDWRTEGSIWLGESRVDQGAGDAEPPGLRGRAAAMIFQQSEDFDWTQLRGRTAAMVFQDSTASLNPIQKVGKQLAATVARLRRVSRTEARRTAIELLRRVEMPDPEEKFHAYPFQLSGGQNQRVMIALALAGEPALLFADEPTTALDVTVQSQILSLIRLLRDDTGMGVVFVTHDLGVVAELCDRVAVMCAGQIVETGRVDEVMCRPQHSYTKGLIASMPTLKGNTPDRTEGQGSALGELPPDWAPAQRRTRAVDRNPEYRPEDTAPARGLTVNRIHSWDEGDPRLEPDSEGPELVAPADAGDPLLELRSAACDYRTRRGPFRAVSEVSLTLRKGGSLAVIGESGSGKSTIGKLMLGIEPTSAGHSLFVGRPVPILGTREHKAFARSVQLVPQNPYLSLDPRAKISRQIEEPFVIHRIGTPDDRAERRNRLLDAVQLAPALADRYPHEISGGQCQRAVIARALALEPKVLICDEATASLDVSVQARIIKLLIELQARFNLSVIFITHDLRLVRSLCAHVAVMKSGSLVELSETEALFTHARHPYTRELLASIPDVQPGERANAEVRQ